MVAQFGLMNICFKRRCVISKQMVQVGGMPIKLISEPYGMMGQLALGEFLGLCSSDFDIKACRRNLGASGCWYKVLGELLGLNESR